MEDNGKILSGRYWTWLMRVSCEYDGSVAGRRLDFDVAKKINIVCLTIADTTGCLKNIGRLAKHS